jgi:hypothetical protein
VRVEGFYKRYSRLLDGNPSPDPDDPRTNFFSVGGESYGADVLLRQFERGPFSGWVAYTYAVAARQLDSLHYFPGHDRRHDLNFVANWRAKKYLIGLRFGYATGTPYTDIVGEIVRRVYDPALNAFGTRGGSPQNEFVGGPRGERVLREERVHVRLRLFRESAHERSDLAVPTFAVSRCLDSVLAQRTAWRSHSSPSRHASWRR